mmetsp:Transcript_45388/g.82951  ORF Transcript_45388/g.82951 Transcript_45388/m.82951 type:complete len:231 (-) Transcript_45388:79-771(-)
MASLGFVQAPGTTRLPSHVASPGAVNAVGQQCRLRLSAAASAAARLLWVAAGAVPFIGLRRSRASRRTARAAEAGSCGCCNSCGCGQERRDFLARSGVGVVGLLGGAASPSGAAAMVVEETGNTCIACTGSGFLECLRCKGTGQMSVIGFTDKYDNCTECAATGRAICPRCDCTGLSKARFKALRKDRKFLKAVNQNLFSHPILDAEGRGQIRAKMDAAISAAEERLGLV